MTCKFCAEGKKNGIFMSIFQIVLYHLFGIGGGGELVEFDEGSIERLS